MIRQYLENALQYQGIEITREQADKFERYYSLLSEWNNKINLTAITREEEVAVKHFEDSLALLKYFNAGKNAAVIDVGTGAGFPGIPLKIVRGDINLTLLDSLNKRLLFLDEVCKSLNISAERIHSRAEDAGQRAEYREMFDVAVSRAVARLNLLCELCLPLVRPGGYFVSMKGANAEQEAEEAQNAVALLGGKFADIKEYALSDGSRRTLFIIEKTAKTPKAYPRRGAKLKSKPL